MRTLWDLNEVTGKECLACGKHSVTGNQDDSGLKLKTDVRDMVERLSPGAELMRGVVDTPDQSSETDP